MRIPIRVNYFVLIPLWQTGMEDIRLTGIRLSPMM